MCTALTMDPSTTFLPAMVRSSSNLCGQADDAAWSRIVIAKRQANTNGVVSNWSYSYYLRTNWPAPPCPK